MKNGITSNLQINEKYLRLYNFKSEFENEQN